MIDIIQIIEIGKKDLISENNLTDFSRSGNEIYFDKWRLLREIKKHTLNDFFYLIKGLHIIEIYCRGFGSPSSTFFLLEKLALEDFEMAKQLEAWIINTGGNYYIPRYKIYSLEEKEEIDLQNYKLKKQKELSKSEQKIIKQEKIKGFLKKQKEKNSVSQKERKELFNSCLLQNLNLILNNKKSIFYFSEYLISNRNEIINNSENLQIWNEILDNNINRNDKAYLNLIKKINNIA
ncbi:hypothetical protein [Soonwooa purpurea]